MIVAVASHTILAFNFGRVLKISTNFFRTLILSSLLEPVVSMSRNSSNDMELNGILETLEWIDGSLSLVNLAFSLMKGGDVWSNLYEVGQIFDGV